MNCHEARLRIGAEPSIVSQTLAGHLEECARCSEFRREMIALDGKILCALETPLMMPTASPRPEPVRFRERWALAAAVLLAFGAGTAFWAFLPAQSLAADVMEHVIGEPASWENMERLTQSAVDELFRGLGASIDAAAQPIVYARACPFRDRTVPHLVIRTGEGPVTVLVLRGEKVRSGRRSSDDGFAGAFLPMPDGSIAVLARDGTDVDKAAREIQRAVRPGQP